MDDFSLNLLIQTLAHAVGMTPGSLSILLGVVIFGANCISRLIPDTATGWLGAIRKFTTFVGIHIRNNTGTLPVDTGVKGVVIPTAATSQAGEPAVGLKELVEKPDEPIPATGGPFAQARDLAKSVVPLLIALMFVPLFLSGCATTGSTQIKSAGTTICKNQVAERQAAMLALQAAVLLPTPKDQQIATLAAQATLLALDACPPVDSMGSN